MADALEAQAVLVLLTMLTGPSAKPAAGALAQLLQARRFGQAAETLVRWALAFDTVVRQAYYIRTATVLRWLEKGAAMTIETENMIEPRAKSLEVGNKPRTLWVLGHRVTLLPVGGRVAALEVVTPAGVPGPPPHHHQDSDEFFYVTSGHLGVMCADTWTSLEPGGYMNVPRGTVHTFRNEGSDDVRVITGFEPQGFEKFFLEYGIDVDKADAFETSVSEATIARVIEGCAHYGMILAE